jgi:hypothetical protein
VHVLEPGEPAAMLHHQRRAAGQRAADFQACAIQRQGVR